MTAGRREGLRAAEIARAERELAGETIAAFAHEANNHLATLAESTGLIGDLLGAAGGGKGAAVGECRRAAAALEARLAQFAELNRRLARFGAALPGAGPTDLAAALEDLLALAGRAAARRRVRLACELTGEVPPVPCAPAAFLALAHRVLRLALERCPEGGTLRVRAAAAREGGVIFAVAGAGPLEADDAVRALAAALGAVPAADAAPGEIAVRFTTAG